MQTGAIHDIKGIAGCGGNLRGITEISLSALNTEPQHGGNSAR